MGQTTEWGRSRRSTPQRKTTPKHIELDRYDWASRKSLWGEGEPPVYGKHHPSSSESLWGEH